MLTAVVTSSGSTVHVTLIEGTLQAAEEGHLEHETEEEHPVPENDLNPIFPEVKELIWGFGSFVVLALRDALLPVPQGEQRDGCSLRLDPG